MVILNIEMPNSCVDCPCAADETFYCNAENREFNEKLLIDIFKHRIKYPEWCPMHPYEDDTDDRKQKGSVFMLEWNTLEMNAPTQDLPELGVDVLCIGPRGKYFVAKIEEVNGGYLWFDSYGSTKIVTAWAYIDPY